MHNVVVWHNETMNDQRPRWTSECHIVLPVTPFFSVGKLIAANFPACWYCHVNWPDLLFVCWVSGGGGDGGNGGSGGGGDGYSLSLGSGTVLYDHTTLNVVEHVDVIQIFD